MALRLTALALALFAMAAAQQNISLTADDGGQICANLYGQSPRAVVLAHGGRFNKESWKNQADALVAAGFQVLAIDFRGVGCSTGPGQKDFDNAPFEKDVLAAVHYLKAHGAKTVSVVGGSFGGGAAGDASIKSGAGEIDRIVFLGAAPNLPADKLKSRSLFIVARNDSNGAGPHLPGIRAQYEKSATQRTDRPRWRRPRPVPFPDEPGPARHARDPALPLSALATASVGPRKASPRPVG